MFLVACCNCWIPGLHNSTQLPKSPFNLANLDPQTVSESKINVHSNVSYSMFSCEMKRGSGRSTEFFVKLDYSLISLSASRKGSGNVLLWNWVLVSKSSGTFQELPIALVIWNRFNFCAFIIIRNQTNNNVSAPYFHTIVCLEISYLVVHRSVWEGSHVRSQWKLWEEYEWPCPDSNTWQSC